MKFIASTSTAPPASLPFTKWTRKCCSTREDATERGSLNSLSCFISKFICRTFASAARKPFCLPPPLGRPCVDFNEMSSTLRCLLRWQEDKSALRGRGLSVVCHVCRFPRTLWGKSNLWVLMSTYARQRGRSRGRGSGGRCQACCAAFSCIINCQTLKKWLRVRGNPKPGHNPFESVHQFIDSNEAQARGWWWESVGRLRGALKINNFVQVVNFNDDSLIL